MSVQAFQSTAMDTLNRTLLHFLKFAGALLVVAALYLGRDVLIPLALACLFTFLLNPLVKRLCRWGLPGQESDPRLLREAGATWVVSSLKEARETLVRLVE